MWVAPREENNAEIQPEIQGVEFAMHQIQLLQMQIAAMSQTVQNLQEYLVAMQQQNPTVPRTPEVRRQQEEVKTPETPIVKKQEEEVKTPEVKKEEEEKKNVGKEEEGVSTMSPEPTREELRRRWALKYSQESPK